MAISKHNMVARLGPFTIATLLALTLAACAAPASKESAKAAAPADETAVVVEEAVIVDDFEGDGMEIPLDGTSLETWNASLAMVKRHTDEVNYVTLQKAINYLLLYDLGAKRSREKLAERLNGLNGYQVIERVGWRKPPPNICPAEKGAADAKIIDS